MDRRTAVRTAVLTVFASAFGKFDLFAAGNGTIRVPLSDWKWLVFDYHGERIALTTEDVFAALKEQYGATPVKPGK
jgi:hypothetical protein